MPSTGSTNQPQACNFAIAVAPGSRIIVPVRRSKKVSWRLYDVHDEKSVQQTFHLLFSIEFGVLIFYIPLPIKESQIQMLIYE